MTTAPRLMEIIVSWHCKFFKFYMYDKNRQGQAAAGRSSTGSFTSAHADGCAEQCFEGVQFGSLFNVLKFFANRLPVCFPALIWFALSEQGRSWRICRAARFYTVRTCLPYEVFKVQYGAVDQPGKALFFKGSFLADVHKTHGSGAERGMRRRLWAWIMRLSQVQT